MQSLRAVLPRPERFTSPCGCDVLATGRFPVGRCEGYLNGCGVEAFSVCRSHRRGEAVHLSLPAAIFTLQQLRAGVFQVSHENL